MYQKEDIAFEGRVAMKFVLLKLSSLWHFCCCCCFNVLLTQVHISWIGARNWGYFIVKVVANGENAWPTSRLWLRHALSSRPPPLPPSFLIWSNRDFYFPFLKLISLLLLASLTSFITHSSQEHVFPAGYIVLFLCSLDPLRFIVWLQTWNFRFVPGELLGGYATRHNGCSSSRIRQ